MGRNLDPNRILYPRLPLLMIFFGAPFLFLSFGALLSGALLSLGCFFLFDSLGVQIGVHKHLCHRSFSTRTSIRRALAFLSVLSGQGSPLVWVAVHVGSHHPHSDSDKDIHSPSRGVWFAFLAWYWAGDLRLINLKHSRDYFRDGFLVFCHRHHTLILLSYWLGLYLAGGAFLLLYAGLLPAGLSVILAGFVNAFLHSEGVVSRFAFQKYKNFPAQVGYNSVWMGILTMGLGFHNNHHADPGNCYNDLLWYEWDPSRLIVPLIRSE